MNDLLKDKSVKGKIRLIYSDPPYATNSVFQTRKLQDAYTDLLTGKDYADFMRERPCAVWNKQYEEWTDDKILKEYPFIEENTGRRHKRVPVHAPGTRNGETGKMWRGMLPPEGKHWQFTPAKLDEFDRNGEIYWSSNGNPRRKVYLDQSAGIALQDIWLDYLDINNQNTHTTGYPTEKNIDMLKRIILASSNKNDLVMDCFAGSGTTLVAANDLNRNWIGVDIGNEAIKVILNRFQHGTKTLDEHINNKKETKYEMFSLFSEQENENDNRIFTFQI
jgi:adenine-specific DNA-methyltransferase